MSINSAWFAGPKAENAPWFTETLNAIAWDYYFWRRNYFPEDAVVIGSAERRHQDDFRDQFEDRLQELLAKLKHDFPFHSPRYAGHMIAEQTLPSIAAYFATMLYNPNNVATDAASVTVSMELEAAKLIATMVGHTEGGWAHLTSGGTMANFEALWMARSVALLPLAIQEMRERLGLPEGAAKFGSNPAHTLAEFAELYRNPAGDPGKVVDAYYATSWNVAQHGLADIERRLGKRPVILAPETHHYCFDKAMDLLGLGRNNLKHVRVDADFRMDVEDLGRQIDAVEESGGYVAMVVAVIGTTEEGAVDPVDRILKLREAREAAGKSSFWLHGDAAYGGYLRTLILPERVGLGEPHTRTSIEGKPVELHLHLPEHGACDALERLGECDSVTIDPHKLGYIPYPAGAISFRTKAVKPLARQEAPYLEESSRDFRKEEASTQIGVFTLEGSKPGAAAAAVWLSHSVIPLDNTGHGALIRETVRNACELHALLEAYGEQSGASVVAVPLCPPGSNIVCYAFRPKREASLAEINQLNMRLFDRFSLGRGMTRSVYETSFFVSRTTLAPSQYAASTVASFLDRLGVEEEEYHRHGVFLLRSVLMNPWYSAAKEKGRPYLSDLAAALYREAEGLLNE